MERNKHWRELQRRKFYIAALKREASWDDSYISGNIRLDHPKWVDLYRVNAYSFYKSVRVPCNCWMCRGERYDRRSFRKETNRLLLESEEE